MRKPWDAVHAWEFVEALLASHALGILVATNRHASAAAQVVAKNPNISGNLMHDAQTAILMKEHWVRQIYTRDTDFHRFRFPDPLNPLA